MLWDPIPCRFGYLGVWDVVPCGLPRRVGSPVLCAARIAAHRRTGKRKNIQYENAGDVCLVNERKIVALIQHAPMRCRAPVDPVGGRRVLGTYPGTPFRQD